MLQIILYCVLVAPTAEKLTAIVDLRGTPARDSFEKLSAAIQERIVIARQVAPEILDQDVRLRAEHLSPDEAVRWVARLLGLEAVHTRDGYYIASAQYLAELGTPLQGTRRVLLAEFERTAPTARTKTPAIADDDLTLRLAERGAVFWQDAPLTRVAQDISRVFRVDLIVDPRLPEDDRLLEWERPDVTLREVCLFLADRFEAVIEWRDGALWLHPPGGERSSTTNETEPNVVAVSTRPQGSDPSARPVASRPAPHEHAATESRPMRRMPPIVAAEPSAAPRVIPPPAPAASQPALPVRDRATVIYRAPGEPARAPAVSATPSPPRSPPRGLRPPGRLTLDTSIRDWSTFARQVEQATGWTCRLEDGGRRYEPIAIDGPAAEVLEALKLMGTLEYRVVAGTSNDARCIEINIPAAR